MTSLLDVYSNVVFVGVTLKIPDILHVGQRPYFMLITDHLEVNMTWFSCCMMKQSAWVF